MMITAVEFFFISFFTSSVIALTISFHQLWTVSASPIWNSFDWQLKVLQFKVYDVELVARAVPTVQLTCSVYRNWFKPNRFIVIDAVPKHWFEIELLLIDIFVQKNNVQQWIGEGSILRALRIRWISCCCFESDSNTGLILMSWF